MKDRRVPPFDCQTSLAGQFAHSFAYLVLAERTEPPRDLTREA